MVIYFKMTFFCYRPFKKAKNKKKVSNYNTHECDFDTYIKRGKGILALNLILLNKYDTHECDLHTQSVIYARKSVILSRTRLVSTLRVRFTHTECDITLYYTYYTQSVLLIHTRVSLIFTRSSVITTSRVKFLHARK
jgi:hypothetical protein